MNIETSTRHHKAGALFAKLAIGMALLCLPAVAKAGNVPMSVQATYPGALSGNLNVVVSTQYVSETNLTSSIVVSTSVSATWPGTQSVTLSLPDSTSYYFYAYVDVNGDNKPSTIEPMGGYGPFPVINISSVQPVFVTAASTIPITLTERATVKGTITNPTSVQGALVVVAIPPAPVVTYYDPAVIRRNIISAISGGTYQIDGLAPGTTYSIQAFVDKDGNSYPNPAFEPVAMRSVFVDSQSVVTSVDLTINIASATVQGAAPDHINMTDSNGNYFQTFVANTPSNNLKVTIVDANNVPTVSTYPVTLTFQAFDRSNWTPVSVLLSSTGFVSTFTAITIPAGFVSSVPFRMMTNTNGSMSLQVMASAFPTPAESRYAYYDFSVLPAGYGFTNVGVRTDSQGASAPLQSNVTITPDHDGSNDSAVFSCTPPDGSTWELWISTDVNFAHGGDTARFWGNGTQSMYWYGQDYNGRNVSNGTYFARFQMSGGGIVSSTMSVVVNSAAIFGRILVNGSGTPIVSASVNIWGPGGGGSALSDSNGKYFVGGLKASQLYTMSVNKSGYASVTTNNMVPSASAQDVSMDVGVTIRVQAARQATGNDPDLWGNVNIHTSDYNTQAYGSMHFMYNSTTSDNGLWAGDPAFSTYTDIGVSAGKTYLVDIFLPNFGQYSKSVTIAPGASGVFPVVWMSTEITRKANAFGYIVLPSTPDAPGASVSIQATKAGDSLPTVFGGGWIQNDTYFSTTSMRYQLYGLAAGQWTFRAQVQGYRTQSVTVNVSTVDVNGGVDYTDFANFAAGGGISGTISVIGDSSHLSGNTSAAGGATSSSGMFSMYVNAWSPTSYQGAWKSVNLATNTTSTSAAYALTGLDDGTYQVYSFLPGFQMEPPGQKQVTVSGGVGSLDLTFRQLSGQININVSLPGSSVPGQVYYEVQLDNRYGNGSDPNSTSGNLSGFFSGTTASVPALGSGLYHVVVEDRNAGSGLRKEAVVSVVNGQTATVNMNMNQTSYSLSGTVSLQGNLILPTTWNVTVSSAAGLQAVADPAPLVQVFAFPLPDHFYGTNVRPTKTVKATPIAGGSDANFTVPGLLPGTYLLRVQEDLNPSMNAFDPNSSGSQAEFATTNQVANITNANVTGVTLTISNGVELSGTISRPDGDTSNDNRTFQLTLRRSDNLSVFTTSATASATGTASYKFQHLAAGEYFLDVQEQTFQQNSGSASGGGGMTLIPPKYAVAPKHISIGNSNVTQDITVEKSAIIVGQLRDSDSNTLITSNNVSQFLPTGFNINAQANPWFEGGYANAEWSHSGSSGIGISTSTNQFAIYRVIPGLTYDVSFTRSQGGLDDQSVAKGQKAYAALVKSGVRVSEGQTVDMGIIDLKQGVGISGTVKDKQGNPLSNIRVQAIPSITQNGDNKWQMTVEAFTDDKGQYVLQGIDRDKLYYDIIAAPRFEAGDILSTLGGKKYGTETLQMVDVTKPTARQNVNFTLTEANGILVGKVATADGGALQEPFDNHGDFAQNVARVVLHQDGAVSSNDNPLGEIEEVTDTQGNFSVNTLKPGSYTMRVVSVGYITFKKNVVVSAGQNNVGTVTLSKGATVTGTLTKPDGSNPSTDEVKMVVGVDDDFQEFVFGSVQSNTDSNIVTGYTLTGFKTGVSYSLMIISNSDDLLEAKTGLTFSASTETKTINLLYRPAAPTVFATQSRTGNQVTVRFFSTHKLRNLTPDDNDMSQIVTLASGNGTIASSSISSSRDTITVVYNIPANESSFKVRLRFTSIIVDPDDASGANFTFDKEFQLFGGVGRMRRVSIANATGGNAKMEGIPTGESFNSGCFNVDRSSRVEVSLLSATSLSDLAGSAPAAAPAARAQDVMGAAKRLGPAAYPSGSLYTALSLAPSVSPFSEFYEVLLPAGVSHSLKKEALLTLHYDDSVDDPSKINVYYFDPGNNVFLLEANKRLVDDKNKTITVAVTHASTFVVLQNNAAIVGANDYAGQEIFVYNFPNPFNLKTKTVDLNNAPSSPTQTIEGTMIKFGLPSGKAGTVKIDIYNVVGELVRTITVDAPTSGAYYYAEWDGKNDGGKKVASGVYLARMTLNGGDEKMFKMAVIK